MKLNGHGEIAVNQSSGYTYLWLEDYPFTLFMNISCELTEDDVYVLYSDSYNGDETEQYLSMFESLKDIYNWVKTLENQNN